MFYKIIYKLYIKSYCKHSGRHELSFYYNLNQDDNIIINKVNISKLWVKYTTKYLIKRYNINPKPFYKYPK